MNTASIYTLVSIHVINVSITALDVEVLNMITVCIYQWVTDMINGLAFHFYPTFIFNAFIFGK